MTIPTLFRLIREACGLTREEMAGALDVRMDTLRAWDSGQRNPPDGAVAEARALYQRIVHASGQLGARIDALKGDTVRAADAQRGSGADNGQAVVTIGLAGSDTAARKLGFPVMAAQHAAVGLALAPRAVALELVPWREGIETARAV